MNTQKTTAVASSLLLQKMPLGLPTFLARLLTTETTRAIRKWTEADGRYDYSKASEENYWLCLIFDLIGIVLRSEDVKGPHTSWKFHVSILGICIALGMALQTVAGWNDSISNKWNNLVTVVVIGYTLGSNASVLVNSKNRIVQLLAIILLSRWINTLIEDMRGNNLAKNKPEYHKKHKEQSFSQD